MVRVAYVIGELSKGGAEFQLYELLSELDRTRFEAAVFVLAVDGYWAGPIRKLGVPVLEFPRRGSLDVLRWLHLRRSLRRFAPQVLHTIRWSGNSYGRLAAIGLGIPLVVAAERVYIERRPPHEVVVDRLLDRVTGGYLVNSVTIADGLVARERVDRAKIGVVHNGIDLSGWPVPPLDRGPARAAAGLDPGRRLVAQVGRLLPQKDYPTFLRAAAALAPRFPDVDFLVVGDGPMRGELEQLAATLGLGERLRFLGLRHDVPALLAGVDVLVLASRFEGLPNVLLEAMASGAVTIATPVGGCPEVVVPGETGFLVETGDVGGFVAAVASVLSDPDLHARLVRAARRRVEQEFSVARMGRATMAFYEERLFRSQPRPASAAA